MEIAELRSKIDTEKLYVEFSIIRTALSVATLTRDLNINLSAPSQESERRGACPKCGRDRAFSLNVNTNRFNCFAKGCTLKGGGVIDFFAKLFEVSAKESSHMLAYVYGIQPYTDENGSMPKITEPESSSAAPSPQPTKPPEREVSASRTPEQESVDSSSMISNDARQSAQYLITSIECELAELKQLLIVS